MNLSVNICGIEFKNPLIAASGTFGFGREYQDFYDVNIWGGFCTKGLTYEKRLGNPTPRIAETPMGALNSVGLQNPGLKDFIKYELPYLKTLDTVVIVNIAGSAVEDYCRLAEAISDCDIDMIELNISCPNVKEGGMAFGTRPESIKNIVGSVRKYCKKPLIVKLSPNVEDITQNAKAAEDYGADAISLINTISGMAVDIYTRQPILANTIGGLSGPAIKPIALKMVWDVYNAVKIPIIGMGGISSAKDVLEFMLCGARAVQVGTYNFMDPYAPVTLLDGLTKLMADCKIQDVNTIVGDLKAR